MNKHEDFGKKGKFIKVKASFLKRSSRGSRRIRMKWVITNASKEKILIVGYYCPFYKRIGQEESQREKFYGAYIPDSGRWIKEEFVTKNDHTSVLLWPGEKREYLWAEVPPSYYGLKEEGFWHYRVRLYYQLMSTGDFFYQDSKNVPLHIGETTLESEQERILEKFFSSPIEIVRALSEHDELILPFPDWNSAVNMSTSSGKRIDLLLHTKRHFIIIEAKRIVTPSAIRQLVRNANWVKQVFGRQYGKGVIGVVLGNVIRQSAAYEAQKSQMEIRLMTAKVRGHYVRLVEFTGPSNAQTG